MKKKMIAGAVALSMLLGGTGYAYWTNTLNIDTTATTGNMDVKFVDLGLYAQYKDSAEGWSIVDGIDKGYVDYDFFTDKPITYSKKTHETVAQPGSIEAYYKHADGYNDVNFNAELGEGTLARKVRDYAKGTKASDQINISLNNIYPGYAQAFRTDIVNAGNVAAKLSKVEISTAGDTTKSDELKNLIGVALYVVAEYSKEAGDTFKLASQFSDDDVFTLGGVDFVRLSAIEEREEDLEVMLNKLYVTPSDNSMDAFFAYGMDADASGEFTTGSTSVMSEADDSASMSKSFSVNIRFLWDQFNEGSENFNIPANVLKKQN